MSVTLPAFYVDNVNVVYTDTTVLRGNVVSDLRGNAAVTAYDVENCATLRANNNKALRIISTTNNATGFKVVNCTDALLAYNVASRCDTGFEFSTITTLNVYNLTAHNCTTDVVSASSGTFRNVALSSFIDNKNYQITTGFSLTAGTTIDLDYAVYSGLNALSSGGTLTQGTSVSEKQILYVDEANDDLTPDHISELVNSGTDNPLRTEDPSIGGVESKITDETTADRQYHYSLIDNAFWDITNSLAAETAFIKAGQSRVFANADLAEKSVERDIYIKTADSTLRFSELYPAYARYANQTKFKKQVMGLWYAGQSPGTLTSYNVAIGGYNLLPSFFKKLVDVENSWIVGESYIGNNNYLLGKDEQRYGIRVDVLGTSTLSQAASAECYKNVQECVADIAPVNWNLHHEPQPTNHLLFTDLYNNFENCTLDNMVYNDDFNIHCDVVQQDCSLITPVINTTSVSASGNIELSVLDRLNSDSVTRAVSCRQGASASSLGSWTAVTHPIGEVIDTTLGTYVQFRVAVAQVLTQIDYEFVGLCLRPYTSSRVWTQPDEDEAWVDDMAFFELDPGSAVYDAATAPTIVEGGLSYPADGNPYTAGWMPYIPMAVRAMDTITLRLNFMSAVAGTALVDISLGSYNELTKVMTIRTIADTTVALAAPAGFSGLFQTYIDVDVSADIDVSVSHFNVEISRDSSDVGDTLASALLFWGARTLEP